MKNLTYLTFIFVFTMACQPASQEQEAEFTSLFNELDLNGWETYMGIPPASVDLPGLAKDEEGNYTEPIGLNNDPLNVFTVVNEDDQPAVRASGQLNGALSTVDEYENYHFRMEMKWGDKKWYDNPDQLRNSGLLYHGVGEYGAGFGVWKKSHECQLMEKHAGLSYRMGDTYCSIPASIPEGEEGYIFDPDAGLVEFGEGKEGGKVCAMSVINEKPVGEWNTIEIMCMGDTSIHIINGVMNMFNVKSHLEENGRQIPLTKGNIELQSEGAEVFFRKMEIRSIDKIPEKYVNQIGG